MGCSCSTPQSNSSTNPTPIDTNSSTPNDKSKDHSSADSADQLNSPPISHPPTAVTPVLPASKLLVNPSLDSESSLPLSPSSNLHPVAALVRPSTPLDSNLLSSEVINSDSILLDFPPISSPPPPNSASTLLSDALKRYFESICIPFFATLRSPNPWSKFDHFDSLFDIENYLNNEFVCKEGELMKKFYVVGNGKFELKGKIKENKNNKNKDEKLNYSENIEFIHPASSINWFGAVQTFHSTPGVATVRCVSDKGILFSLTAANWSKYLTSQIEERPNFDSQLFSRTVSSLRSIPLFSNLLCNQPYSKFDLLGNLFIFESLPEYSVIWKPGDRANKFFLLLQGQMELIDRHGNMATLDEGDHVGELELLRTPNRQSTLIALTNVTVHTMDAHQYELFGQIAPELKPQIEAASQRRRKTEFAQPQEAGDLDVEKVIEKVIARNKAGTGRSNAGSLIGAFPGSSINPHHRPYQTRDFDSDLFSSPSPREGTREETRRSKSNEKAGGNEPASSGGSLLRADELEARAALNQTLDDDVSIQYPTPSINSGAVQRALPSPIHSQQNTINKSMGNPFESETEGGEERERDQTVSAAQRALALTAVEEDQERSNTKSIVEQEREFAKQRERERLKEIQRETTEIPTEQQRNTNNNQENQQRRRNRPSHGSHSRSHSQLQSESRSILLEHEHTIGKATG